MSPFDIELLQVHNFLSKIMKTKRKEVSLRLMWVKVKFGQELWVFVGAYGPGSERDEEERETFWNDVDECLQSFGTNVNVYRTV